MPISISATKIVIVGFPDRWWFQKRPVCLGLGHMSGKNCGDCARDFILNSEDVAQLAVIPLGPAMGSRHGIDELCVDANTVASSADAALEHIAHAELACDLADVGCLSFVLKSRISRDHQEFGEPRQFGDDVLGDAVAEVLLLYITAEISER